MTRILVLSVIIAHFISAAAHSAERLEGYFIAEEACEAFQSKKKRTNPGNVMTQARRAYEMIAINKKEGDHFQIRFDDVPVTNDRWVHVDCGVHVVEAGTSTAPPVNGGGVVPEAGPESTDNLLALSWQPAFCETRPSKTECVALNNGDLPSASEQLSIHGLWPQPRGKFYCGVSNAVKALDDSRQWFSLPAPELDDDTRDALAAAMPGVASGLDRHEWIKHGTCHKGAGGADEYFDDTLMLVDAINDSPIGAFFAEHVGARVETADIRALFDAEFGAGAGKRVQFNCKGDSGRVLIQELKINLKGVIKPDASVSELLLAADETSIGCPRGVIDPAGLQ